MENFSHIPSVGLSWSDSKKFYIRIDTRTIDDKIDTVMLDADATKFFISMLSKALEAEFNKNQMKNFTKEVDRILSQE